MKNKFIKACENKFKTMKSKSIVIQCCTSFSCESCYEKVSWGFKKENEVIPKDVPKGHLVVYVGDDYKRFVIKMSLLKHPIFKALLDLAQDAYDFSSDSSKLWIPCDENTFLDVNHQFPISVSYISYKVTPFALQLFTGYTFNSNI
ncbi:hypothetical protein YC2023_077442 [Brassica napus]